MLGRLQRRALLPPQGSANHFRDCFITRPRDRGITSHGEGDQGMMIDRCQFLSDEARFW